MERMAAQRDQCAAKRAKQAERSIVGPRRNMYQMVDHEHYCGSAYELDRFLDPLCSNFNSYHHLFTPGGPDHIEYAIPLLHPSSNHQNPALRQAPMTDHSLWAGNISAESGPCLKNFNLVSREMAKVYEDNDRRHVAVTTMMQEYTQLPQESVRAYANRGKARSRQAGWNL